jgi:hypothetical protein
VAHAVFAHADLSSSGVFARFSASRVFARHLFGVRDERALPGDGVVVVAL